MLRILGHVGSLPRIFLASILGLFLVPPGLVWSAAPVVRSVQEDLGPATVDWTKYQLVAVGRCDPRASSEPLDRVRRDCLREAEADAEGKLAEALSALPLSANQSAGDRMRSDGAVAAAVLRHRKEFRVRDVLHFTHGGVRLTVELDLLPVLDQLIGAGDDKQAPVEWNRKPGSHTGLVIELGNLAFSPLLAPRLVSEDGQTLFHAEWVEAEAITERGAVGYSVHGDGSISERVGKKPFRLEALRIQGRDTIVLPSLAMRQIWNGEEGLRFLQEGRVTFEFSERP